MVASSVIKISTIVVDSATSATSNIVTGHNCSSTLRGFSCFHSMLSLHDKKTDKQIDERTFEREVTKKISGSVSSVGGSVGGAVIGQMRIPIPIVGSLIGRNFWNIV